MALVTRLLVNKHSKINASEDIHITDTSFERQHQITSISNSWKRLFAPKRDQKGHWTPSLSGILKAGDEGLFSSTLFLNLHGYPGAISVDALYEAFANELRNRPVTDRSLYSGDVARFISENKRGTPDGMRRSRSVSHRVVSGERRDLTLKANRKSLDLSAVEMGLARSMSMKRQGSVVVSMSHGLREEGDRKMNGAWMKDGQNARFHDGRRSVKLTSAELAALSIVLGSPVNCKGNMSFEKGAYGVSIHSAQMDDGKCHFTLKQHKLSLDQQHAQGTGSSLLFSKHLAVGCIPFTQDKKTTKTLLITTETFETIRAGAPLRFHPTIAQTPQPLFLASLPHSHNPSFCALSPSSSLHYHNTSTLLDAISAMPFTGGLTAITTTPTLRTIQFIACGGLSPARLLSRLESLIEKVHRQAPHFQSSLFGPLYEPQNAASLYRERLRLSKISLSTDAAVHSQDQSTTDTLAHKTARMSRYVALLQRLISLLATSDVGKAKTKQKGQMQDIPSAVRAATRLEFQRSYQDALAIAHADSIHLRHTETTKHDSVNSRNSRLSTGRPATSTPVLPVSPPPTLARQLDLVLKMDLPLRTESIAFVARMVVVAWTMSVASAEGLGIVDGDFHVQGSRPGDAVAWLV